MECPATDAFTLRRMRSNIRNVDTVVGFFIVQVQINTDFGHVT